MRFIQQNILSNTIENRLTLTPRLYQVWVSRNLDLMLSLITKNFLIYTKCDIGLVVLLNQQLSTYYQKSIAVRVRQIYNRPSFLIETNFFKSLQYWNIKIASYYTLKTFQNKTPFTLKTNILFNQYFLAKKIISVNFHNTKFRVVTFNFFYHSLSPYQQLTKTFNNTFNFNIFSFNIYLLKFYNNYFYKIYTI